MTTPLGGGSGTGGASSGSGASGNVSGGGAAAGTSGGTESSGAAGETAGSGGSGAGSNVAGASGSGGSSAGTGGSGAAGAGAGGEPPDDEVLVIDDMEDGDPGILLVDGRNGYWYSGNDGTAGTQEPPANAFTMVELSSGDRSAFAASLKASGFTGWGSVMGLNFVEQATVVKAYDASAFCGVEFWGKAAAVTTVNVRLPDGDTHPNGNVCTDGGGANQACYDHFGLNVAFTTAWKLHRVEFSALRQTSNGYHPADGKLKVDKLYALEWALPGMGKSSQIWVDDVAFVTCP